MTVEEEYTQYRKTAEDEEWQQMLAMEGILTPAGPVAEEKESRPMFGSIMEYPTQVIGGVRDFVEQAWKGVESAGDWLRQNVPGGESPIMGKVQFDLMPIKQPTSTTGSLVRNASQFMAGFIPGGKIARGLGITSKVLEGAVAGSIADFTAFDPTQPRVSDAINKLAPALANPLTDFLKSDPSDAQAEGRMKNAVEGLLIGGALDSFVAVVRAMRVSKIHKAAISRVDEIRKMGKKPKLETVIPEPSQSVDDAFQEVRKLSDNWDNMVEEQRRGVRPREAAREEGERLGMTVEEAKGIEPGTAMADSQAAALINLQGRLAEDLQASSYKAIMTGSEEDIQDVLKRAVVMMETDPKRFGVVAEAGRTLGILNDPLSSLNKHVDQFAKVFSEASGLTPIQFVEKIASLKTPGQVATMMRQLSKPGAMEIFQEVWINALLSNPATHAVNFLSSFINAWMFVGERGLAAQIGGGKGVAKGEATVMLWAMTRGTMKGFRLAKEALLTGKPAFGTQKQEIRKAISSEALQVAGPVGSAVDVLGAFVSLPTRALITVDDFWKGIFYQMELEALAYRKGMSRAGQDASKEEVAKIMNEIIQNPPAQIKSQAEDFAKYGTFQKELGELGHAFQQFKGRHPAMNFVAPFVVTPTNIFKVTLERTPGLNMLLTSVRNDLKAGGVARELALAKVSMGSMTMAAIGSLSAAGFITGGGPRNKELRAFMQKEIGWQPYSLKINGKYYSLNRADPIGALLGVAANFVEICGELDEMDAAQIGAALVLAPVQNILSKTLVTSLANVFDAVENPTAEPRILRSLVGTLVPSGVAQIERQMDPTLREAYDLVDFARSRIPWSSGGMFAERNIITGDPIMLGGGLGPDWISPIYTSTQTKDPVLLEIGRQKCILPRLPKAIGGVLQPDNPLATESVRWGIPLTPEQRDKLGVMTTQGVKIGGRNLRDHLEWMMKGPAYAKMSDGPEGGKSLMIKQSVQAFRALAQERLKEKYPALGKLFIEKSKGKGLFLLKKKEVGK